MIDEKRLRELCARALRSEGADFDEAIKELGEAIESNERANPIQESTNHHDA